MIWGNKDPEESSKNKLMAQTCKEQMTPLLHDQGGYIGGECIIPCELVS